MPQDENLRVASQDENFNWQSYFCGFLYRYQKGVVQRYMYSCQKINFVPTQKIIQRNIERRWVAETQASCEYIIEVVSAFSLDDVYNLPN